MTWEQIILGIGVGIATVATMWFTLRMLDRISERDARDRGDDGSLRV